MTKVVKTADLKNMEPTSSDKPESTASEIEATYSLNLRHETAIAWVMPDSWEPLHG